MTATGDEDSTAYARYLKNFYDVTLSNAAGRTLYTLAVLLIGGICEIGGGWLIWQGLRNGRPYLAYLIPGFVVLSGYGVVMTLQMLSFSRAFATYGGVFIVLSLLWGRIVDGVVPDKWDIVGAVVAAIGAAVIAFVPRST